MTQSIGEFIARYYIRDPERAHKVKTLVELRIPHVLTPVDLDHLIYSKFVKWIDLPVVDKNFA